MLNNPILESIVDVPSEKKASNLSTGLKAFVMFCLMLTGGVLSWYVYASLLLPIAIAAISLMIMSLILAINNQKVASFFTVIFCICTGFAFGSIAKYIEDLVSDVSFSIITATATGFFLPIVFYMFDFLNKLKHSKKIILAVLLSLIIVQLFIFLYTWLREDSTLTYVYGKGFWILLVGLFVSIVETVFTIYNFDQADRFLDQGISKKREWMVVLALMFSSVAIYYQVFMELKKLLNYVFEKQENEKK